jgi:hypothetical protein
MADVTPTAEQQAAAVVKAEKTKKVIKYALIAIIAVVVLTFVYKKFIK